MKREYDFSKGTRGKFYRPGVEFRFPVYLEPAVQTFVQKIADAKDSDIGTVVNEILKSDMRLAKVMR